MSGNSSKFFIVDMIEIVFKWVHYEDFLMKVIFIFVKYNVYFI